LEGKNNMSRYTAGIPIWDESWGQEPSIYDIVKNIPTSGNQYPEPDFRIETTAPFWQDNTLLWILLAVAAILLLSGDSKEKAGDS
jgi:hypothetical protein